MAEVNFNCGTYARVVITYDLSPNDVTAEQISAESNGSLKTTIEFTDKPSHTLPNTTLYSGTLSTWAEAKTAFKNALSKAKAKHNKKANISKLFVVESSDKNAYIENN